MTIILLACRPCVVIVNCLRQVLYLGRAPRTKETLPDFCECRVGYPTSTSIPRVINGHPGFEVSHLSYMAPWLLGLLELLSSAN